VPLRKRAPKTLDEAYGMAKEIKNNIFSSGMNDLFTSGTLTMESLYSHEDLVDDFQEEGKQTVIQHEMIEDMAEEQNPEQNDEVSNVCLPLMKSCKNLSLLCSKAKMRLVIFHFKILMILCYLIQKKKRKWKPWMK
jgi:hypothetical protein